MESEHRILIVDDDPVNLDIMLEILASEYSCAAASTGEDALKTEKAFRPDIILLDIMMPGMDGYEVCRRIRAGETHRFTKIILVSGKSMTEDRLKGYEVGADDYITKPFNDDELLAKIKVFLKLKRLEEVDSVKRDIINIFSHETRTPLSAIVGPAEMLLENEHLDRESRELAELILQGAKQIADLVHKTTMLCRLKSGFKLRMTDFQASECLNEALRKKQREAAAKNITIKTDIISDSMITGDREALTEALTMLMENAVIYSRDNSEISVRILYEQGTAVFSVEDCGEGLDDETKSTIFGDFSITGSRRHIKGMGIGLSIVKHIAEMHGGGAEALDSECGGAVFRLSVPCKGGRL
ncbi:hybrid sensor histidine kinase/response regulator [Geovibrio thiophilus]|uniref:histidine kinase n=1 Tax=Geovibrio thiophilus TaxID=139438 RepID=A0A410K0V1_9BACT|nr:hybrid sensor histidine kinase/response regulator [Geovibrio thiophilus]QAR33898.1 hybrid sensor histidine kinase/response regulator [Geovibrio thiophilus]